MRSKTMLIGSVLLSCALLVTGCAKPPQVELDGLKAAVSAAEAAGAATYAGTELGAAREALNAVTAEIDAQAKKFALFRSYKKALELIGDANNKAKAASEAAVANKAKAKGEAEAAVTAAKDAVTAVQTALTELEGCRRKPKGFAEDLAQIKGRVDAFVAGVSGLDSKLSGEDYFGAKSEADSLAGQAATLTADIAGAKTKIKC